MNNFDYVQNIVAPWLDKFFDHGAGALTSEEALGVGVWLLEADVNNGGFDQYYFNSAGDFASTTVGALRKIGAHRTAEILAAANSEFPNSLPPSQREERQLKLDEISGSVRFAALEAEFWQGHEDLTELLALYFTQTLRTT